jgi:hypothetical protein
VWSARHRAALDPSRETLEAGSQHLAVLLARHSNSTVGNQTNVSENKIITPSLCNVQGARWP